jgi:PAS domain S-box-containing protein
MTMHHKEWIPSNNVLYRTQQAKSLFDIVDNIPIGLFSTTLQGKMVFCSKRFATILGYPSPADLLNCRDTVLHPEQRDVAVLFQMLAEKGEVANAPVAMLKKDGSQVLCAISAKTVSDKYGQNFLLDGLIKEIPKHRKPTRRSRQCSMPFRLNLEGVLIDISKAAARFMGRSKQRLLNKSLIEFLPAEYHAFFYLSIKKIIRSGHQEVIMQIKNARNEKQLVELSGNLVKGKDQKPFIHGLIRPFFSISKKNNMIDNNSRDRFQGALEMAGGVSHTLNQPLTIINHTIEDLLRNATECHRLYPKIVRLSHQVEQINTILQKIRNVKKYSVMDYVSDLKIIDIDRAC